MSEKRGEMKLIRTWPGSKLGVEYEMREGKDGVIYCSCPGWKFSRERPRSCKHMVKWAETIVQNGSFLLPKGA